MSTEASIEIPGELQSLQSGTQAEHWQGARAETKSEGVALVQRNIQSSKTHALQAAGEFKTAVEAKGRELLHVADELLHAADGKAAEMKAKAETAYGEAKGQVKTLQRHTEHYVRENPLGSVCIALGAGFLLGILARR
jgi:ElaB/YqjD/DUF883 family membrane-anchored ribosome-binding protein